MSADVFQSEGAARLRHRQPIDLAHEPAFRLGDVTVTPALRELAAPEGIRQTLEPRVMQVLVALARADGGIVTRDDLISACWRGAIVGEDSINRPISLLRRVSEGIGRGAFRIETLPRVGYRLSRLESERDEAGKASPATRQWTPGMPLILGGIAVLLLVLAGTVAIWRSTLPGPLYSVSVQPFQANGFTGRFGDELSGALTRRGIPTAGGRLRLNLTGAIEQRDGANHLGVQLIYTGSDEVVWSNAEALSIGTPADLVKAAGRIGAITQCIVGYANDAGRQLPLDLMSRFARSCELIVAGKPAQGIGIARALTRQMPDFAGGWFALANHGLGLYFRQPHEIVALRQEAERAAEKLIALRPNAQEGYVYKAMAMDPAQVLQREQLLRRAVTLEPIFADFALANLGDFLLQTGRFEEAFQLYRANAQKHSDIASYQAQLFFSSAATERWPIVDEALERIGEMDPTPLPNLLWRRAVWSRDWAQAEKLVPLELPAQEKAMTTTYRALASGKTARKDAATRLVLALPADCCIQLRIEMLTLLGRHAEALALLDKFEAGSSPGRRPGNIGLFLWDPVLRPLWHEPGILPFLQRHGWIAYWRESKSAPDICRQSEQPSFCRALANES